MLSKNWVKENRAFLIFLMIMLASVTVIMVIKGIFFERFIKVIYEKKGIDFLIRVLLPNNLCNASPLDIYYLLKSKLNFEINIFFLVEILFFIGFYLIYSAKVIKKGIYLAVLCGMFIFSIMVRYSYLNRPLSDHYEFVTAQSLLALKNWETQGALKHKFCILQSYSLKTDKFIWNTGMRIMNDKGDGYYVSEPPFSLILPYLIFKLFFIPINALNLQIFNLFFHALAVLFVYLTILLVLGSIKNREFYALLGSVFFIFLPSNLWLFSNIYSWDIFWHYLWVAGIFFAILIFTNISEGKFKFTNLYVLGVLNFLLVYTEYQGLLFALSLALFALYRIKSSPIYKKIIFSLLVSSILAFSLFFLQNSTICGPRKLAWLLSEKANLNCAFPYLFIKHNYVRLTIHYLKYYAAPLFLIILLVFIVTKGKVTRLSQIFSGREKLILYLAVFPVLIHHFFAIDWSARHDYSVLKSSLSISFLIAILFSKLKGIAKHNSLVSLILIFILASSLSFSIFVYRIYCSGSKNPGRYYEIGEAIKNNISREEVVFTISDIWIIPQVIYYSGRNIQIVSNSVEAKDFLRYRVINSGKIFYINSDYRVFKIEKVFLQ